MNSSVQAATFSYSIWAAKASAERISLVSGRGWVGMLGESAYPFFGAFSPFVQGWYEDLCHVLRKEGSVMPVAFLPFCARPSYGVSHFFILCSLYSLSLSPSAGSSLSMGIHLCVAHSCGSLWEECLSCSGGYAQAEEGGTPTGAVPAAAAALQTPVLPTLPLRCAYLRKTLDGNACQGSDTTAFAAVAPLPVATGAIRWEKVRRTALSSSVSFPLEGAAYVLRLRLSVHPWCAVLPSYSAS